MTVKRQGTNAPGFPPKPWTIGAYQAGGTVGLRTKYFALNIETLERGPTRESYDEALRDIPSSYAEPWGV